MYILVFIFHLPHFCANHQKEVKRWNQNSKKKIIIKILDGIICAIGPAVVEIWEKTWNQKKISKTACPNVQSQKYCHPTSKTVYGTALLNTPVVLFFNFFMLNFFYLYIRVKEMKKETFERTVTISFLCCESKWID